jgi:hypothetical protein
MSPPLVDPLMSDIGEKNFLDYERMDSSEKSKIAMIMALDFSEIKAKVCESLKDGGFDWSYQVAENTEMWYKRFLILHLIYGGEVGPCSKEVDDFWHMHILDTFRYSEDCQKIFGHFMHHVPCSPMSTREVLEKMVRAAKKAEKLFVKHWGRSPRISSAGYVGCNELYNDCSGKECYCCQL